MKEVLVLLNQRFLKVKMLHLALEWGKASWSVLLQRSNLSVDDNIYILLSTDRSVSFNKNASVRLNPEAGIETLLTVTPIQDSSTHPRGKQHKQSKFKRLCITIVFVYIYLLNGDWEFKSFEEPCNTLVATINYLAGELNPTGVGERVEIVWYE